MTSVDNANIEFQVPPRQSLSNESVAMAGLSQSLFVCFCKRNNVYQKTTAHNSFGGAFLLTALNHRTQSIWSSDICSEFYLCRRRRYLVCVCVSITAHCTFDICKVSLWNRYSTTVRTLLNVR